MRAQLKKSIDHLLKTGGLSRAELEAKGAARVDPETVLAYASDLGSLLDDAEAATLSVSEPSVPLLPDGRCKVATPHMTC